METDEDFNSNFDITSVRLDDKVPTLQQYKRMNQFVTCLLGKLMPKIKKEGDDAETLRQNMRHFASICMIIFNPGIVHVEKEEKEEEDKDMHGHVIKHNIAYEKTFKWQTGKVVNKIIRIVQLAQEPREHTRSIANKTLHAKIGRQRAIKGGSRKLSKKRSVTYRRRSRRRNTNKIS
jgi:predicted metal-binding protein